MTDADRNLAPRDAAAVQQVCTSVLLELDGPGFAVLGCAPRRTP